MLDEFPFLHLILCTSVLGVGVLYLIFRLRNLAALSLIDSGFLMAAATFGFFPWISYWNGGGLPYYEGSLLFLGYMAVMLYLAGIALIRMLTIRNLTPGIAGGKPAMVGRLAQSLQNIPSARVSTIFICYGMVWVLRNIMATQYGSLFSGDMTDKSIESDLTLPYSLVILRDVCWQFADGVWIWSLATMMFGSRNRALAFALLAVEAVFSFTSGRSAMTALLFIALFTQLILRGRLRPRTFLIFGVAVFVLWVWIWPAFYAIRIMISAGAVHAETPVGRVVEAIKKYSQLDPLEKEIWDSYNQTNLATRGYFISFILEIMQRQRSHDLMMGKALLRGPLFAIPRVFLPLIDKGQMSEGLVARHYDMPLTDYACTWPAMGVADFGLIGATVAGLLFGGLLALGEYAGWSTRNRFPFAIACLTGAMLRMCVFVEQAPETTFSVLRTCIFVLLIFWLLSAFRPRQAIMELPETA